MPPRAAKHSAPNRITGLHLILAFWGLVGLCIVVGYFIIPKKPPAPAPSAIQYARRPTEPRAYGSDSASYGSEESRGASPVVQSGQAPPPPPKSEYAIYGVITEAKSGAAARRARISYQREWSDAEKAKWQELRDARTTGASEDASEEMIRLVERCDAKGAVEADAQGRYTATPPRDGLYRVQVHARGYLAPQAGAVTLTTDEKRAEKNFALSLGASISGRVIESRSKKGAPDVPLYAHGENIYAQDTKSKSDGTYRITGLAPGAFRVSLDLARSAYQVSGPAPTREVTIERGDQEVTGVDFSVEEAGIIWGYVLDPKKQPIQGADVVLCSSESIVTQAVQAAWKHAPPLHCTSNADGYYELLGVPLNTEWRVYGQAKSHAPQLSDPLMLTDSKRQAEVDLFVMPGSTVYGRVVNSVDGSPIARAEVSCIPGYARFLSPMDAPAAFRNTKSNADGQFVIPDLPIGEYQILAMHDRFKFATSGEPIYPDGQHPIANIQVALIPVASGEYTVFGTVTGVQGNPVEGASLHLLSASAENMSGDVQEAKSDAQGQYQFTGVDAGFFMLIVEAQGYTAKTVDKVRLNEATDISLIAGASISGQVLVRETNKAPEGYQVRAVPTSATAGGLMDFMSQSDLASPRSFHNPDGSFEFSLPAGSYTLQAFSTGLASGAQTVELSQGDRQTGVTLYVSQNGGRIQGRVVLADGKSAAGAVVSVGAGALGGSDISLMLAETMQRSVQVGDDGRFTFNNLAAGSYVVAAQYSGYAQGRSAPLTLDQGQTVSDVQITLGHGGELQGYVTIDGQLRPGMVVTVVGNGFSQMATTDRNGQYRIEGIPAGTYLASAINIEGVQASSQFAALHTQVQISDGSSTTYNFGSEGGATIAGTCAPPPSTGTVGIALLRVPGGPTGLNVLSLANPSSWYAQGSAAANYIVGMARLGADGYFTIPSAPRGTFILDVYYLSMGQLLAGGGKPVYSASLTIPDETPITVEITVKSN